MTKQKNILLSHIVPARNDNYLGNFKQRLEMMINYVCKNVVASGNQDNYELIVCDYNSESPLRHELYLTNEAMELTKFVEVPASVIKKNGLATDYPIHVPFACNVSVRHAQGKMIMVSPADMLMPQSSIANLFQILKNKSPLPIDITNCYIGIERFLIPWQISLRMSLENLDDNLFIYSNAMNLASKYHGLSAGEGAHLISKDLLMKLRGLFDESMPYWGGQELQLSLRINQFAPSVKLSKFGVFAYDLQQAPAIREKKIKINTDYSINKVIVNDENWGLNAIDGIIVTKAEKSLPEPHKAENTTIIPYQLALSYENFHTHFSPYNNSILSKLGSFKFLASEFLKKFTEFREQLRKTEQLNQAQTLCLNKVEIIFTSTEYEKNNGNTNFISSCFDRELSLSILKKLLAHTKVQQSYLLRSCNFNLIICTILSYSKLQSWRILNLNSCNDRVVEILCMLDPTIRITTYHDWKELKTDVIFKIPAVAIRTNFQGYLHQVSGPRETAIMRIKNTELLNEPYDFVFIDLDYWTDINMDTLADLSNLLAPTCSIVCAVNDINISYLLTVQELLKSIGFELKAHVGAVCTLVRTIENGKT